MDHATFHEGEQTTQQHWQTAELWDSARKARLLWDHNPEAFQTRIEAAPFFSQVGCLFVDFNDGGGLRVNGRASVHDEGPVAAFFPEHRLVVLVGIEQVVPNCPQHIRRLQVIA
ncbi:MAG: hypothetical protein PHV02_19695 [Rhodocyclaceae bacterium]|nr:hypothetical protein [Rhodocyclaceae bacterium]